MNDDLRCRCTLAMQGSKAWPAVFAGGAASELLRAALSVMTARLAQARIEALEEAALACERQERAFFSPEYATGQPLSSFKERFAVSQCAKAIRALKDG